MHVCGIARGGEISKRGHWVGAGFPRRGLAAHLPEYTNK